MSVKILHFAEAEKEPLSRKILGKAAQKALGKGTGPSNLPKSILASFCHASKNGRKKAQKSLKLLGFSQRHLFWCSLMVAGEGFEPPTSGLWATFKVTLNPEVGGSFFRWGYSENTDYLQISPEPHYFTFFLILFEVLLSYLQTNCKRRFAQQV